MGVTTTCCSLLSSTVRYDMGTFSDCGHDDDGCAVSPLEPRRQRHGRICRDHQAKAGLHKLHTYMMPAPVHAWTSPARPGSCDMRDVSAPHDVPVHASFTIADKSRSSSIVGLVSRQARIRTRERERERETCAAMNPRDKMLVEPQDGNPERKRKKKKPRTGVVTIRNASQLAHTIHVYGHYTRMPIQLLTHSARSAQVGGETSQSEEKRKKGQTMRLDSRQMVLLRRAHDAPRARRGS